MRDGTFYYSSLLTRYLRSFEIEEEVYYVFPPHVPILVCTQVDVTKTKLQDVPQGPVLSTTDRRARDYSWMGWMHGMCELQLRIIGHLLIDEEMITFAEHYLLTDNVIYICLMGP